MSVKITGIKRLNLGTENPYMDIDSFKWINEQSQTAGVTDRVRMYEWIVNNNGQAYVRDEMGNEIFAYGVLTPVGEKYIRTAKDRVWTDDLLKLPSF